MLWNEVRAVHPDQWLVIEALEAHSANDQRVFDRVAVADLCADGRAAMKRYAELQHQYPHREFCFVHSSRSALDFDERVWFGIRGRRAVDITE